MKGERSPREIAAEWNERAKAEGHYLEEELKDIPVDPGSIFDVPVTPEAAARIKRLDAHIAQRKRERAMAIAAGMQDVHERIEGAMFHDSSTARAES